MTDPVTANVHTCGLCVALDWLDRYKPGACVLNSFAEADPYDARYFRVFVQVARSTHCATMVVHFVNDYGDWRPSQVSDTARDIFGEGGFEPVELLDL